MWLTLEEALASYGPQVALLSSPSGVSTVRHLAVALKNYALTHEADPVKLPDKRIKVNNKIQKFCVLILNLFSSSQAVSEEQGCRDERLKLRALMDDLPGDHKDRSSTGAGRSLPSPSVTSALPTLSYIVFSRLLD